ncbi:MAG: CD1871A family CXXC motif-containing protein [Saccharofermentanales bacterium]|jgi:hypothetical protein|nr:CD1871A family CXXC motif-containing protein [Bacillota bacterium]NLB08475.1 thioredoxin [Clostridiales bacterium]
MKRQQTESATLKIRLLRLAILALAIVGIIIGVKRQEVRTVFSKAIRICLECIGLG